MKYVVVVTVLVVPVLGLRVSVVTLPRTSYAYSVALPSGATVRVIRPVPSYTFVVTRPTGSMI